MSTKILDKSGLAYFWSKIKAWCNSLFALDSAVVHKTGNETVAGTKTFSSIITGSVSGNAGTATKLATARLISAGDLEFQGSANFDGSSNIVLNVTNHRSIVTVGNTNNYPFHRIAYVPLSTGSYKDSGITFLVNKDFHGGGYGIARIIFRTNNAASQVANCVVQWLSRTSDIAVDAIQVGFVKTAGASYLDVFYKSSGTYNSAICRVLACSNTRNGVGRGFTVVSASTEANSTTATDPKTSVESYKTIADAGTALHSQSYTDIIVASDAGVTGNAATASAVAWSGVTGKPTTIAGYGITDAKIANGTITLGSNSITPLTSHQTLPTLSRTISGSGNAITDITVSGHAITATKGATFLTSHQTLPTLSLTTSGNGNAITALSVSDHAITATKGASYITSSGSITGNAATATKTTATVAVDTTGELVRATMGSNDVFRIAVGGASNAGWAEIATGDDYSEPIYVRQYQGAFTTLKRTATLLDGSGNTSFPGTVTATGFSGPLTGNVTGNATTVSGTAGTSALAWNSEVTLYTVGGHAIKAKLPANPNTNTDTLMTQNVSTTDATYPILAVATADATTNQGAKTGIFGAGIKINPSDSKLIANYFIANGMDGIRFRQAGSNKYTSFIRNDGGSTYWLLTNANDPDGTWNSLRPLTINNATGVCSISGNAATVTGTAGTSLLAWNTENTVYTVGGHAIKVKLPANPNTDTHWTSHLYAGASNGNTNAATTNGNTYLIICDNSTARDRRLIKGTGATTVTSDANGVITIHSTDNNTTYSAATQSANGLMSAADKKKLDGIEAGADNIPVGTVIYYAKSTVPTNFLICNGGAVSRTTYATLFGVIGTTFGAGNGSSTFNVPNLIDRFPQGNATPGTVKAAGLPNITGSLDDVRGYVWDGESGAFYPTHDSSVVLNAVQISDNNQGAWKTNFDASRSSAIYGKSSTVQPPALTLVPCIRYA